MLSIILLPVIAPLIVTGHEYFPGQCPTFTPMAGFNWAQVWYLHTDSVEHFDDFRRRKSGQNDDFRGRFYAVAEFASLGAENVERFC